MRKLLFQPLIGCLGTSLFIGYFSYAAVCLWQEIHNADWVAIQYVEAGQLDLALQAVQTIDNASLKAKALAARSRMAKQGSRRKHPLSYLKPLS